MISNWASPPGDTIVDILENRGLTQDDLAKYLGLPLEQIPPLISGNTPMTRSLAEGLGKYFGIPFEFWLRREMQFRKAKDRIDKVLAVEAFLKDHSGEFKRTSLWKALPCRLQYGFFKQVIEHLGESGKILIDCEGFVVWVHNPEYVKKMLGKPLIRLA